MFIYIYLYIYIYTLSFRKNTLRPNPPNVFKAPNIRRAFPTAWLSTKKVLETLR